MKILKLAILLLLLTCIQAQELELSSAEKFNKRGYFSNEDITVKGSEVISDYDGNFMFNYPLVNVDLPDNLGDNLTLTYNANVGHKGHYISPNGEATHLINHPEWIIGYKGIALQTLNFETNIYFKEPYTNPLNRSEVPLLIPGYHYSNNRKLFDTDDKYDNIQILRQDGSKIIMQNVDVNKDVGIYKEQGKDARGFAIVQYIDHDSVAVSPAHQYRRVVYKPGDGLSYVFLEDGIAFGGSLKYNSSISYPRALYLTHIFSPNGNILHFHYDDQLNQAHITNGRKVFRGMQKSYLATKYRDQYSLSYTFTSGRLQNIRVTDLRRDKITTVNLSTSNTPVYLFSLDMDQTYGRILSVSSIVDNLNRSIDFSYVATNRNYGYYQVGATVSSRWFDYTYSVPSTIDYYNGKRTELEFHGKNFPGVTATNHINLETITKQALNNVMLAFRDSYTNFMLKKRSIYNRYGNGLISSLTPIKTKEENYSYTWDHSASSDSTSICSEFTNGINTIINTVSFNDLNANQFWTYKTYKQYRTDYIDYNTGDNSATIKLVQEKVTPTESSTEMIKKTYVYDWGNFIPGSGPTTHHYDGTFLLDSLTTEKQSSVGDLITKSINYNFDLENIVFQGESIVDTIKVKSWVEEFDGKSLYSKNEYKHYASADVKYLYSDYNFVNSATSTPHLTFPAEVSDFYKIELPLRESTYSPSCTKSIKEYQYDNTYPLEGYVERISNKTDLSRTTYSNYSYLDPQIEPDYGGLPSVVEYDNGVTKTFSYPNQNGSSFNGFVTAVQKDVSGNEYSIQVVHNGFQTKPFKTITEYNSGKTITTYSSFNPAGNLEFEIDANNYITEMAYDEDDRLVAVAAPGSFIQQGMPFVEKNHYFAENSYRINSLGSTPQLNSGVYPISYEPNTVSDTFWSEGYFFFDEEFIVTAGDVVKYSIMLEEYFNSYNTSGSLTFQAITSSFSTPTGNVSLSGSLTIDLQDYNWAGSKEFEFDISNLVVGQFIYGIKISTSAVAVRSAGTTTGYGFYVHGVPICERLKSSAQSTYAPSIVEQTDTTGSKVIQYLDDYNRIVVTDRTNPALTGREEVTSLIKYDSYGKQRQSYVKNSSTFEEKLSKTYNYVGKLVQESSAGVTKNYSYDFLGRLKTEKFAGASNQKVFDYTTVINSLSKTGARGTLTAGYTEKTIVTDENSKTSLQYSDVVGNKVAQQIGNESSNDNITLFEYDDIYRNTKVGTPEGLFTDYYYDNLSNIYQKTSPDDGTYFYGYDKWGNLRRQYHSSTPNEVTYNNYDDLNRLTSSGIFNNDSFPVDGGDVGVDATHVLVNMYDSYNVFSVFSQVNFSGSGLSPTMDLNNLKGRLVGTAFRDKPGDPWNFKFYSYDHLGRVTATYNYE